MNKKQLVVAIQAALFSMAMSSVSAEPLTADDIAQLDETTISEVAVEDIPAELANQFIAKITEFEDLSTLNLSAELAQFLLDQNESADPPLNPDQIAILQGLVNAAIEAGQQAINGLTEATLDTIQYENEELQIGDVKILSQLFEILVEKVASFTDFSMINAAVAQFLLDHNDPSQLSEDQVLMLQAKAAIEQLTEATLETVTWENEELMIGEVKILTDLYPQLVAKVASLSDLSTVTPPVAQFLLDHNEPPQLIPEQMATLESIATPPPTPNPAEEAISQLTETNLATIILTEEQHVMIGEIEIPAELIPKLIEQIATLTDLNTVAPDVAQFILDQAGPESPLTEDQRTTLEELSPPNNTPPSEGTETITLLGTIRDFSKEHPDFEGNITDLHSGCVEEQLNEAGKPVLKEGNPCEITQLDEWYSDDIEPDRIKPYEITLNRNEQGIYTFAKDDFFPIDNELMGNEDEEHNYHFTYEVHSQFTYQPGQVFHFRGDDDVWVFINNQLVVDLGGTHPPIDGEVHLDDLELTEGETYSLDLFFAERHTDLSTLMMETAAVVESNNPVADLDIPSLDAQAVSELSVEIIASLTIEQIVEFQPEALTGLTDDQLEALSDEVKMGMTPEQVIALGDKAKELFTEDHLVSLFTTENGQVTICHVPEGNPGQAHSLDISPAALEEHLNHGDSIGPCSIEDEAVDVVEIDLAHLTASELSELPPEILARLTAKEISLIPVEAMIGMSVEQVSALTEEGVFGLSLKQVLALSSEALAGFHADNIAGLRQEVLSMIGLELLKLMLPEELQRLSESRPQVIVLVLLETLEPIMPPQPDDDDIENEDDDDDEGEDDDDEGEDDDDEGEDDDDEGEEDDDDEGDEASDDNVAPVPSDLQELLVLIDWEIKSNQLVLPKEAISTLPPTFFASLEVHQFLLIHPSLMEHLNTEQMTSIKEETLAQLDEEYLEQIPEETLQDEQSEEFWTRFIVKLDVKKIEKKYQKKYAKGYADYLEKFYQKFLPKGWQIKVKEKHGKISIKIKPKKEAFKWVSKQFVPILDLESEPNETPEEIGDILTLMPTESLAGLEDEQVALIPEEQLEQLPQAVAKPVRNKQIVIRFVEQASIGEITEAEVEQLTSEVMVNIQPMHIVKFQPRVFKLFTAVQISSLPVASVRVLTAPMVAQLTPIAVTGFQAPQISALPPQAIGGFNATMIANLQVTAVIGFKQQQLAFLPIEAMEGWKPATFAALDPNEVDGFTTEHMLHMLHEKPTLREAITEDQWENLPITPETPILPVEEADEDGEETSGEETTGEETSGEETTGEETSGEETTGEETTGEETTGEETSGEETTGEETTGEETTGEETSGEETTGEETTGEETTESTPVEVAVNEETGQVELPKAEIDLSEEEEITQADLDVELVDLNTPLVIEGEELPPVVEQLEETLTEVGVPDLSVTQADGIVNVTGSGNLEGMELALVADEEEIVRVEEGTPPSMEQDDKGRYIVTTTAGIRIALLPAPKNPVQLLKVIRGKKGKGKLKMKKHGAAHFPVMGYGNIAAMFDPFVMLAPEGALPGIIIEGTHGMVVYPDGKMQMIRPAMPSMAELQVATLEFLGLEVSFEYQMNGTAQFELDGRNFKILPNFEVAENEDVDPQPVLDVNITDEGEQIEILNEEGEVVSQKVTAKATLSTEEGTQVLNIVEDVVANEGESANDSGDAADSGVVDNTDSDASNGTVEPEATDEASAEVADGGSDGSTVPEVESTFDTTEGNVNATTTGENTEPVSETTTETTNSGGTASNTNETVEVNSTTETPENSEGTVEASEQEADTTTGTNEDTATTVPENEIAA